jgi:hypothetical protein
MKSIFKHTLLTQALSILVLINLGCQPSGSSGGGGGTTPPPKTGDPANPQTDGNPNPVPQNDGNPAKPTPDDKTIPPKPGDKPADGTDKVGNPAQPLNCEELWASHVKSHPLGMQIQRQSKTSMISRGTKTLSSDSMVTEKVTFNNDSKVVTLYSTDMSYPVKNHNEYESVQEKDAYIELCKKSMNNNNPPPNNFDIVKLADETVTVKAGTFNCSHIKMTAKEKTIANVDKMVIDSWTAKDNPGLVVKSIQSTIMNIRGNKSETLTETELVLYKP